MLALEKDGHVDLAALMQALAAREVNELLVECAGATLSGALLEAGLGGRTGAALRAAGAARRQRPWHVPARCRDAEMAARVELEIKDASDQRFRGLL